MAEEYELGTVGPIPTVNPNVAKIGEMLKIAKKYADQYYVKENIPLIGGMTLGETLLGKAPEEVERWGQGDYPFRNPATVVGTGGNRLDIYKTGRFEPTFDVLANVALPIVGTGQMAARPIARTLGPKAAEMAEDYLTRQGAIANIVEPSPVKIIEPFSKVDELGFHSPLENAILKIQQTKGTGDQFLKQLEKTPGVKTEELEVTGLKQYLLDHPTVTKQELLDQMATSRVKLEQKVLPKQKEITNNEADYEIQGGDIYHDDDYIRSMADDLHNDLKTDEVIRAQEREALLKADPERYVDHNTNPYVQAKLEEDIDNVLFEQAKTKSEEMYYESPIRSYYDDYGYEIHGNDEMGYSVRGPGGEHVNLGDNIYDIADVTHELRMHHLDRDILDYTGNEEDFAKYADYVLPGQHENYREVLTTLPQKHPLSMMEAAKNYYEKYIRKNGEVSWDQLNDAQQLNFAKQTPPQPNFNRDVYNSSHFDEPNILAHTRLNDRIINGKKTLMVEEIQSDWHQAGRKQGYATPETKRLTGTVEEQTSQYGFKPEYKVNWEDGTFSGGYGSREAAEAKAAEGKSNAKTGVPNAPFKKNWHELMMKQILNEAVKGDYEAVAFTTGKQQAARYNLSKQIDSIDLIPAKEGDKQYVLQAWKNGNNVIRKAVNEDELPDLIGKEPAKKLLEQNPTGLHRPEGIAHGNPNVFEGRNLSGLDLDVGGEGMKKFYDEILPNFINKYGKKYGMAVRNANTQASLQGEQVHMVDLTDAAKKDIKEKGQPLFSGIGLAPAPLLMDYEDN